MEHARVEESLNTVTMRAPKNPVLLYAFNSLKRVRLLLRPLGPVLRVVFDIAAAGCFALNKLVSSSYRKLWPVLGIHWFDHDFDHLFGPSRNKWTERGTWANRYIKPTDTVLDVACGDGSYSGNYYSQCAAHVDAFDYDEKAIATARRKHKKQNVSFFLADATQLALPRRYEVILFFASIEHFSVEDGSRLLQKLGDALMPGGVLFGSTPIFAEIGGHNEEHQNEFLSVEQLRNFLAPHFEKVELWSSEWLGRVDCYFECRCPRVLSRGD